MTAETSGGIVLAVDHDSGHIVILAGGRPERIPWSFDVEVRAGDVVADGQVVVEHATGDWPAAGSDALHLMQSNRWEALRRRADVFRRTRAWFDDAGFLEVETPAAVRSAGTEVHLDPVETTVVGQRRFLITSPEYHMKRLLAAGAPPIYQLCRVWRDGERGGRHRPEFTMLEWYRPLADYHALMDDCEAWLSSLVGSPTLTYQGRAHDLRRPWRRLTFRQVLRERGGVDDPSRLTLEELERVLVDRVEPTLGQDQPEFLCEYPIEMASLARPKPGDPTVAERVELFMGGLELGNGFSELTDATEQQRRCEAENAERRAMGKPEYPLDERFLDALAGGMPPSAGIAVGMDRVVMLLADRADIAEVLTFPDDLW